MTGTGCLLLLCVNNQLVRITPPLSRISFPSVDTIDSCIMHMSAFFIITTKPHVLMWRLGVLELIIHLHLRSQLTGGYSLATPSVLMSMFGCGEFVAQLDINLSHQ